MLKVVIPRSWYRAQKPLKPGNTKKIRKNYEIPHPRWGPETTKKIQKKYENGPKMTVFVFFQYFFRIFGARPGVGDFVIFSYFFRISGLEGFLGSIPGTRNHKLKDQTLKKTRALLFREQSSIAASIAFLFHACFQEGFRHYITTITRLSFIGGTGRGG